MKNVQVYINDELIDLVPGQAVAMTYQLNDVADLKNQRANFSNVFKAARSKQNDRKLGFVSDLNSNDKKPYRLLPARIIIDGEDVVTNGYATIKKVDKYYNIVVYSGLLDLYEKLGDKKLKDLDLSEFNHTFDLTTIQSLLSATDGICYPIIDYGQLILANKILIDYMRFSIYMKEIIERIYTEAGFTFTGEFFDHPHYDKLLLPFSNDKLVNKSSATGGSFTASNFTGFDITVNDVFTIVEGFTVSAGNGSNCFDGSAYTVGANNIRGKFSFDGTLNFPFGTRKIAVGIMSSTRGILGYFNKTVTASSTSLKITVDNIDYDASEVITLQLKFDSGASMTITGTLKFIQDTIVPFKGFIPIADNVPDMKQKDFLKAVAQLYGLVYDIDLETQDVRMRFFDNLLINKAAAKDWSTKLDISKQDTKEFALDFAQNNHLSWSNGTEKDDAETSDLSDSGRVPYSLGRGVITSDNQNLPLEKDAVVLPFAATEEVINTETAGFQPVTLPLIKIFIPTNQIFESTYTADGQADNAVPFYYSPVYYTAVIPYNPSDTFGFGNNRRCEYNGHFWEWQSDEQELGKVPGADLDNDDDGTTYEGKPYWKPISPEIGLLFKQSIKVKPRIVLAQPALFSDDLEFEAEQFGGIFFEDNVIIPAFNGHLDFTTRVSENYKVTQDTANNTKTVKAYFTLTPEDIKTLDFLVPIYIGYYSNFFYISRLDKYQQGESTQAELVKI
jgi:hypothetical protein